MSPAVSPQAMSPAAPAPSTAATKPPGTARRRRVAEEGRMAAFILLSEPQPLGERIGQPGRSDGRGGARHVVLHAVVARGARGEVQLEPRGPRVAVSWLPHAARVEDPLAAAEVELVPVPAGVA